MPAICREQGGGSLTIRVQRRSWNNPTRICGVPLIARRQSFNAQKATPKTNIALVVAALRMTREPLHGLPGFGAVLDLHGLSIRLILLISPLTVAPTR